MREKYCFRLEIYDRLRASEQAEECTPDATAAARQHILETPREHVPKDSCVKAVITNSKYKHISFYLASLCAYVLWGSSSCWAHQLPLLRDRSMAPPQACATLALAYKRRPTFSLSQHNGNHQHAAALLCTHAFLSTPSPAERRVPATTPLHHQCTSTRS